MSAFNDAAYHAWNSKQNKFTTRENELVLDCWEAAQAGVLDKVFEQLDLLAKRELDSAKELLTMVQELAPHSNIDQDLDSLAGLTRKAMLRQRVGHAYKWAKQHLKAALDLPTTDAEDSYAVKNHPTERA